MAQRARENKVNALSIVPVEFQNRIPRPIRECNNNIFFWNHKKLISL